MRNNQYENVYTLKCNNFNTAAVDGNFPASTAYIDTSEFTHFCFKIFAGTLDSALTCQVKQDTSATETASIKDVTGATVTVGTSDDNEWVIIEVETAKLDINNNFRYVTLAVSGAAGGNDYLCVVFEGWNARNVPVTQHANYSAHVLIAG
jgi:hypothetical protein